MPSYEEVRYHFNHHDPFARHMGIELLEVGPEHGVAIMPLDERHRNGMGHAHGGAIFALVDMTFATVSNAAGLYCVNAQTNISYLEPGRIGPLRGEARKIRSGRNLGTYDVAGRHRHRHRVYDQIPHSAERRVALQRVRRQRSSPFPSMWDGFCRVWPPEMKKAGFPAFSGLVAATGYLCPSMRGWA